MNILNATSNDVTVNGGLTVSNATTISSTLNVTGNITGTLSTASQPNITSVGTLSTLNVSNDAIVSGNVGIGSTNPQAALDVGAENVNAGDIIQYWKYLHENGSSVRSMRLYAPSSDNGHCFEFMTNDAFSFTVDAITPLSINGNGNIYISKQTTIESNTYIEGVTTLTPTKSMFKYIWIKVTAFQLNFHEFQCWVNDTNVALATNGSVIYFTREATNLSDLDLDINSSEQDVINTPGSPGNAIDGNTTGTYLITTSNTHRNVLLILGSEVDYHEIQRIIIYNRGGVESRYGLKEPHIYFIDSDFNTIQEYDHGTSFDSTDVLYINYIGPADVTNGQPYDVLTTNNQDFTLHTIDDTTLDITGNTNIEGNLNVESITNDMKIGSSTDTFKYIELVGILRKDIPNGEDTGDYILHINELEVWIDGINYALSTNGGSILWFDTEGNTSEAPNASYPALNAIDGNNTTFAHANITTFNSLRLKLSRSHQINKLQRIRIRNRYDSTTVSSRLGNTLQAVNILDENQHKIYSYRHFIGRTDEAPVWDTTSILYISYTGPAHLSLTLNEDNDTTSTTFTIIGNSTLYDNTIFIEPRTCRDISEYDGITFRYVFIRTTGNNHFIASRIHCFVNGVDVALASNGSTAYFTSNDDPFTDKSTTIYHGNHSPQLAINPNVNSAGTDYQSYIHSHTSYTLRSVLVDLGQNYNITDFQRLYYTSGNRVTDSYVWNNLYSVHLVDENKNDVAHRYTYRDFEYATYGSWSDALLWRNPLNDTRPSVIDGTFIDATYSSNHSVRDQGYMILIPDYNINTNMTIKGENAQLSIYNKKNTGWDLGPLTYNHTIRDGGATNLKNMTNEMSEGDLLFSYRSEDIDNHQLTTDTNTKSITLPGYKVFTSGGYISSTSDKGIIDFTGQHRLCSNDERLYDVSFIGYIVSSNGNYKNLNSEKKGKLNNININESLPNVDLSTTKNDKKVIGIISNIEDENNNLRTHKIGVWGSIMPKSNNDTRLEVNSLGEGAIWVSDIYGPLENGDYITSSEIPGVGGKQDDDLLHNYTVAKITMDCDFSCAMVPMTEFGDSDSSYNYILDPSGNIQYEPDYLMKYIDISGTIITEEEYTTRKENSEQVYRMAFVGCTYHCG